MAATAAALNGGADSTLVDVTDATRVSRYMGISVRETAGATAVLRIREGSASGAILDTIYLAANDSITTWYGPMGKKCSGDLVEDWVSGAYEGSVFVQ